MTGRHSPAGKDEWLRERAALPAPLAALPALADGTEAPAGKGRIRRADGEEASVAALGGAYGLRLTRDGGRPAPAVRLSGYRSVEGRRLLFHVVNYHVPLGTEPAPVEPVQDVTLVVPLPTGVRLTAFRVLSPDRAEAVPAEVVVRDGAVRLALPLLGVYAVVELRTE